MNNNVQNTEDLARHRAALLARMPVTLRELLAEAKQPIFQQIFDTAVIHGISYEEMLEHLASTLLAVNQSLSERLVRDTLMTMPRYVIHPDRLTPITEVKTNDGNTE